MARAMADLIVRRAKVNRQRTPQQALDATGRQQYTNYRAVDAMPRGDGEEVEVCFFKVGDFIDDDDLEKDYELRGLVPDPYAQAAVNEADPAFADEHPNATHWKGADGRWHCVAFRRWNFADPQRPGGYKGSGERYVSCNSYEYDVWNVYWWFGGVRKPPS